MWKPEEVVPQHKGRAVALFLGLIVAILGYTGLLVYQAVKASENPSTSFVLSNEGYRYPDIYVCLYGFRGCDDVDLDEACVRSAQSTEGGNSTAVFNPDMENEQDIRVGVDEEFSLQKGWCVHFAASEINIPQDERDPEDYVLVNMFWYTGGSADASDTCIEEEGEWESHSESVQTFLRDADTGNISAGIQVAYTCRTSASNSHVFNYMGIGLTKENKLKSNNAATYKAVATSSSVEKDKRDATITGITSPYAWLSMEIAQQENSLEVITEINPLEVAEILGNVGGFWDLLLLLWPVFFVAVARQDPHLKVRHFKTSMKRGTERVARFVQPVRLSSTLRRRNELARRAGQQTTADEGEEKSAWDTANASAREQNPQREHSPRRPRVSEDTSSRQSPLHPSVLRTGVARFHSPSQGSRLRSTAESPLESGASHDLRLTRLPSSRSPVALPRPLRAASTANLSSSRDPTVFTV